MSSWSVYALCIYLNYGCQLTQVYVYTHIYIQQNKIHFPFRFFRAAQKNIKVLFTVSM